MTGRTLVVVVEAAAHATRIVTRQFSKGIRGTRTSCSVGSSGYGGTHKTRRISESRNSYGLLGRQHHFETIEAQSIYQ
jgi:hypothetical protein